MQVLTCRILQAHNASTSVATSTSTRCKCKQILCTQIRHFTQKHWQCRMNLRLRSTC